MPAEVRLEGLQIRAGSRDLVADVSLRWRAGQVLGVVGASGSGKTLTARAILGLLDLSPGVVRADLEVEVDQRTHRPYAALARGGRPSEADFAPLRGAVLGYLPQHARASLDPLRRVGRQIEASAALAAARQAPAHWLAAAGFAEPAAVLDLYPHELSGGMAQRVAIALALARGSRFLVADEPTTGLDPTVQQALLRSLRALAEAGLGILLITHDLRALAEIADAAVVIDAGRSVETLTAAALSRGACESPAGQALYAATRRIAAGRLA